jgi:uncharacterized SAM-binding protein YcdF (DUF218 family)
MPVVWWVTIAVVGIVLLAGSGAEAAHWVASRLAFPVASTASPDEGSSEVVVVLGCVTGRNGRVTADQRWRTRIAVRSRAADSQTLFVFTGGATRGASVTEAATMAAFARTSCGIPAELIATETEARSTWENLAFTTPFLEAAGRIKLVSDPLHAARARRYLRQSRPDLFARLSRTDDYRPGEHPGLKVGSAVYELSRPVLRRYAPSLRDHFQGRSRPDS